MNQSSVLDISWSAIIKIGIAALSFYIIYLISDILVLFIFATVISILFNPVVDFLQRRKIPRILSVLFVYIGAFGIITILIYLLSSPFIVELKNFSQILPEYFEKISPSLRGLGIAAFKDIESFIGVINRSLEKMTVGLFGAAAAIFGGVLSTLFVITVAIFLSLEERAIERGLLVLFPKKYENFVLNIWHKSQKKISGWFLSRIISCVFVGVLSYFSFLIINTKYPLSLGISSGFLNFIPFIGPVITGILIILLVSLDSMSKAIIALVAFTLIQQIENNILTPILTKKFIDLSPVLVLVSIAVGGKLLGFWGAILAIPFAGILVEFARDYLKKKREEETAVL